MLITEEYRKLNEQMHAEKKEYGTSGVRLAAYVKNVAEKLGTQDILDYGCGKGTLAANLPFDIHQYDPCIPEYSKAPEPADIVICSDVLEHIEPDCLVDVLDDLYRVTKQSILLVIHHGPAKKHLPDGRNAHLIQEDEQFWLTLIMQRFIVRMFHCEQVKDDEGSKLVLEYRIVAEPRPGYTEFKNALKETVK